MGQHLIKVEVTGRTPLLMHRFGPDGAHAEGHRAINVHKLSPREQAEHHAYRDETTRELYVPGGAFFSAIKNGGSFHKLKNRGVTTKTFSFIPGVLVLEPDIITLGVKTYELDERAILNEKAQARVMLYRPKIFPWVARFRLYLDDDFPLSLLRDVVDDAGRRIGVGSYRPQRGGTFGKFTVTRWDVSKAPATVETPSQAPQAA